MGFRLLRCAALLCAFAAPLSAKTETFKLKPCYAALQELHVQLKTLGATADTRAVQAVYANPELGPESYAREAFNIYMNKRLEFFPPEVSEHLRDLTFWNQQITQSNKFDAFYDPGTRLAGVWTKKDYVSSLLTYEILVHELEHAIQHQMVGDDVFSVPLKGLFRRNKEVERLHTYLIERSAIASQWAFLRMIPQYQRQKMIEQMKEDSSLPEIYLSAFIPSLENAHLPLNQYLSIQIPLHGYSMDQLQESDRLLPIIRPYLTKGMFLAAIAIHGYVLTRNACRNLLTSNELTDHQWERLCEEVVTSPPPIRK